jgi:hydrogenase expression/formation protein HypC
MKITSVLPDESGEVEMDGARTKINLSLIENPAAGEYVIVHAGFAIEKLDTNEADSRIGMFEDLERIWGQQTLMKK